MQDAITIKTEIKNKDTIIVRDFSFLFVTNSTSRRKFSKFIKVLNNYQ